MKKLSIYLGIIVVLFGLLYYVDYASDQQVNKKYAAAAERLYQTSPDKLQKATRDQLNDSNYQAIILPDELSQKLANEESLLVYMFSPVCSYCLETTPVLMEIANQVNVPVAQLNVFEFGDAWTTYNLESTPTLIYFENGKEAARLEGGIGPVNTREVFTSFLQEHNPAN